MIAMLIRRLALASFLCLVLLTALDLVDRPPAPLLVAKTAGRLTAIAIEPEKPTVSHPSPYLIDGSTVVEVICSDGGMGSAVYLGSGTYITAAHVLADEKGRLTPKCWIFGQPVAIVHVDVKADYAFVRADHFPPFHAPISCERLQEGAVYYATGYADGHPWPVTTRIRGQGIQEHDGDAAGTADINGSLVSGMSGGSVADIDGFVHAINDWRDDDGVPDGGVVELADTPLCKGKS